MVGLAIACAIGIPGGLLMGGNKYIESILSPYVWALASLPRIALVPLFILSRFYDDHASYNNRNFCCIPNND